MVNVRSDGRGGPAAHVKEQSFGACPRTVRRVLAARGRDGPQYPSLHRHDASGPELDDVVRSTDVAGGVLVDHGAARDDRGRASSVHIDGVHCAADQHRDVSEHRSSNNQRAGHIGDRGRARHLHHNRCSAVHRTIYRLADTCRDRALPQWGLNQADVVYEELVEARLTRFAAIFHSTDADVVGPVRSARTGDFALLSNLNRPIFVNSGANAYTARALRSVDAVAIIDGAAIAKGVFERSPAKNAPHNLITDTARIYGAGTAEGRTPPRYLRFRDEGEALPRSTAASGVDIDFGQIEASYRWDAAVGGWARTQNGRDHTDFDGVRVAPENVIVQFVRYRQSPADAATPEPVLTGGGEAWIFTDGVVVRGTWERLSELDVTVFRSDNALIVPLTPGRTWIALARAGTAEIVP